MSDTAPGLGVPLTSAFAVTGVAPFTSTTGGAGAIAATVTTGVPVTTAAAVAAAVAALRDRDIVTHGQPGIVELQGLAHPKTAD